jgi:hypothetical protein
VHILDVGMWGGCKYINNVAGGHRLVQLDREIECGHRKLGVVLHLIFINCLFKNVFVVAPDE